MRNEIAQYIGFSPEERARREKGMAELAALDAKRFDPDRRRSQGLTRWLLGGAGRTGIGSVLGGAGAANENYNESMDAQERQSLLGRQKQMDELIAADVGTRKTAFDLGLKSAIDYAQIAAKQAANALGRESMDQNRAFRSLSDVDGDRLRARSDADKAYEAEMKRLGIFGTPTPAQTLKLEEANTKRALAYREIDNYFNPLISQLRAKAGVASPGTGFTFLGQRPTP